MIKVNVAHIEGRLHRIGRSQFTLDVSSLKLWKALFDNIKTLYALSICTKLKRSIPRPRSQEEDYWSIYLHLLHSRKMYFLESVSYMIWHMTIKIWRTSYTPFLGKHKFEHLKVVYLVIKHCHVNLNYCRFQESTFFYRGGERRKIVNVYVHTPSLNNELHDIHIRGSSWHDVELNSYGNPNSHSMSQPTYNAVWRCMFLW